MHPRTKFLALLLVAATGTMNAHASPVVAEETDPYAGNLLGNWGGARTTLANAGIDVDVDYKADLLDVTHGGQKTGSNYMDNLGIGFELDGEKILGIKGNKALISFINNDGGKTNGSRIGSAEGVDNIETGTNTFKLYEAWMEQSFFDDKLAVLVGLHDLNSEFDETDMTANFLKPTMQIGQSFAQSGQNGPDIFPNTGLATRVKISPTEETYLSVAAFEGIPGDPSRPHGTHIDLTSSDGALLIAEAGFLPKSEEKTDSVLNKFAIGGWMYTKPMADLVTPSDQKRMAGAYLLSSYELYHDKDSGHGIGGFFRAGMADGDTAQVDWDYEAGLVATGWVPTRPDAAIGAGFTQAHNGSKYVQSVGVADNSEYGMELYYRDPIARGITVQPDLQYVINPGSDTVTKNATVIGIRFDVNF